MSVKSRGTFIVVEGLDRAGKTTQLTRLVERLKNELGLQVEGIKFPDRTTQIGQNLNSYLTSTGTGMPLPLQAAHLLFSANRWEAASSLVQKLRSGTTLIADRYSYSGAVYTTAKASISTVAAVDLSHIGPSLVGVAGLPLEWTWAPEVGLPAPDMLLFMDIDTVVAAQRGGFGDERYETSEMQRAVRRTFYELMNRIDTPTAVVDAGRDVEPVGDDIWDAVTDLLEKNLSTSPEIKILGPLRQLG